MTTMPYVGLDITDKEVVRKTITEIKPDAVIHCAAWTAVDMAEDDDKVVKVRTVNAGGTQNIADACKATDSKMLLSVHRLCVRWSRDRALETGLQGL